MLAISKGTIVDGTGAAGYVGTVLVEGGRVLEAGPGVEPRGQVLDASGLVVAPGFIDAHSHSDLVCLHEPALLPKVHQGITVEVTGMDGMSVAPIKPQDVPHWRKHLSGLDGDPPIQWDWTSFADYLDRLTELGNHHAPMVGHGTLRLWAMGMANRAPTPDELKEMQRLLDQSLEAGACGLSTGLIYSPAVYSETEEIVALGRVVARHGKFVNFHMRYEGHGIEQGIGEVVRVGRESGAGVHIAHFKCAGQRAWGLSGRALELVEQARAEGLDVTADQYPYTAASTMLGALLPPYAHAEGTERLREMLQTPADLERLRADIGRDLPGWESILGYAGTWDRIYVSSVKTEENAPAVGQNLQEIAERRGVDPFQAMVDLLLEEDFAVGMVLFMMSEEDVEALMQAPWNMVGTDGLLGGSPHPRVYGTFPRILGRYVREKKLLSLVEAVRKMTSLPAERHGLTDRGVLAPGKAADLVVFDPDTVLDTATYQQPRRPPEGIPYVFVAGEPVVWEGESTGKLPGHVLRTG